MKRDLGFGLNMGDDEDQPHLDQVLEQIQPNMNPGKFLSFMQKKDNTRKDPRNKAIARKFQAEQEEAAFRQTNLAKNFPSARTVLKDKRAKSDLQAVDEILHAFEVVNKDAIKQGMGGGIHGPASTMLSGIRMLRSKHPQGPLAFVSDSNNAAESSARWTSHYNAGLVRHNIVTRQDLMKLYQPPIKKSQLPTKDPFLTKTIVPRPESMQALPASTAIRPPQADGVSRDVRQQSNSAYATVSGTFPRVQNTGKSSYPFSPVYATHSSSATVSIQPTDDLRQSDHGLIQKHSDFFMH